MKRWSTALLLALVLLQPCIAQSAPAPEFRVLFAQVLENYNKVRDTERDYIFVKREAIASLDEKGQARKTVTNVYDVFWIGHTRVERLLTVDGKPLSPKEERKQQKRVDEVLAWYAEQNTKAGSAKPPQQPGDAADVSMSLSDLLLSSEFGPARREVFAGREILRYDFHPNPGFEPKRKAEELINKASGAIWIDEQAAQIVRIEGRLEKGIRFGWFLGSLAPGASLVVEQQEVEPGIWLPKRVESEGKYRFLIKGGRQRYTAEYSDFRKFSVETFTRSSAGE